MAQVLSFFFGRWAFIILSLLMIVTAVISGFGLSSVSKLNATIDNGNRGMLVAERLELHLVDAETGQRGYIITGDDTFLDIYQSGLKDFKNDMFDLMLLNQDDPQKLDKLRSIISTSSAKRDSLFETMKLNRENGDAARQVGTQAGKKLMDQFRDKIDSFQNLQQQSIATATIFRTSIVSWTAINIMISMISFIWLLLIFRSSIKLLS